MNTNSKPTLMGTSGSHLNGHMEHYSIPPQELENLFLQLAQEWRAETLFLSSLTAITAHPAYQRIIAMGWPVVPLLLAELRREPQHWFTALKAITGEDPVPAADRGRLPHMTKAWLAWGLQRGYA